MATPVELRRLEAVGRRPLRNLCLLMAAVGPVPTMSELRAMIEAREGEGRFSGERAAAAGRKGASIMWKRRRTAQELAAESARRAAEYGAAQSARMLAWHAERREAVLRAEGLLRSEVAA